MFQSQSVSSLSWQIRQAPTHPLALTILRVTPQFVVADVESGSLEGRRGRCEVGKVQGSETLWS
jgi:hypothetical protein